MTNPNVVSGHYGRGDLLQRISDGIERLGKTSANVSIEDLVLEGEDLKLLEDPGTILATVSAARVEEEVAEAEEEAAEEAAEAPEGESEEAAEDADKDKKE